MTYRLFLSSPGDVADERAIVRRVVDRINAESPEAPPRFELFRWEEHFYTADQTFQDQVVSPHDCDLVVCVFWKRLGTELPPHYQRPDGTIPTGTEFEFEDALRHAVGASPKTPDVLVYRKTAAVTFSEESLDFEKAQRDRFLSFWNKWFHSEKGHFVAAFQQFEAPQEFERLLDRHLRDWLEKREPQRGWTGGSPFRGLRTYEVEQARLFFGRERETDRARARLLTNAAAGAPVLLIAGASGSGKSSLIRAGLLAGLLRPGAIPSIADDARALIATPAALAATADWAAGLAAALFAAEELGPALRAGDFDTPAAFAGLLRAGSGAAAPALAKALQRIGAAEGGGARVALILVIDQLEEIFRYPPEEAEAFAACLADLLETAPAAGAAVVLIFGMRSDHRHRLQDTPSLARLAGLAEVRDPMEVERVLDLSPPGEADIREMILGPARLAGMEFETDKATGESLAALIEAEAGPDALPALQLLLTELYERRDGAMLTLAVFRELGGVRGVMAARGETVVAAEPEAVRAALPRVLRALAAQDRETPGPVARRVATDAFAEDAPEGRLLAALLAARLVVADGGTLRVAHESLLRDWPRAAALLEEDRRFFEIRERLGARARRWAEAPAADARRMLLREFELAEGRELMAKWGEAAVADAEPELPGYVRASVAAARRRRLGALAGAAALIAVIVSAGFTAWMFRADAADAARRAIVSFEIARAGAALRSGDVAGAAAAAAHAVEIEETVDTRSALAAALIELSPHFEAAIAPETTALAWRDAERLGFADERGLGAYDAAARALSRSNGTGDGSGDGPLFALAALPGDDWLAVDDKGGLTAGADALPFDEAELFLARAGQVDAAVVGGIMVALADDYEGAWLRVCRTVSGLACRDRQLLAAEATAVALSETGNRVAVAYRGEDDAPRAAVFDVSDFREGGGATPLVGETGPGSAGDAWLSLAWAPDGGRLALGGRSGRIDLAAPGGAAPDGGAETIRAEGAPATNIDWSPRGDLIAAPCASSDICLLAPGGRLEATLRGHGRAPTALAFSPDGARLASQADDEPTRIWRVAQIGGALTLARGAGRAPLEALDASAGRLAAAGRDGVARIWPGPDAAPVALPPAREGEAAVAAALSGDGALAVAYGDGAVVIWDAPFEIRAPDRLLPDLKARRIAWTAAGALLFAGEGEAGIVALDGAVRRFSDPAVEGRADGIAPAGGLAATSHTGGAIRLWRLDGGLAGGVPAAVVGDPLSAFSLSAHPGGRWLTATRGDDRLRIYDLAGGSGGETKEGSAAGPAHVDLPLLRRNTKAVAFSAAGGRLAALDAEGTFYVWDFDPATGAAEPLLATPAAPRWLRDAAGAGRAPVTLDWLDGERIAVATTTGDILTIDVETARLAARAADTALIE